MKITVRFYPDTIPEAQVAEDIIQALRALVRPRGGVLGTMRREHLMSVEPGRSWQDHGMVLAADGQLDQEGAAIPRLRHVA